MVYNERALYNYFIPCHRKYSDQPYQCDIRVVQDGKVGCNTVEYTVNFLFSDWLYALWHCIKHSIPRRLHTRLKYVSLQAHCVQPVKLVPFLHLCYFELLLSHITDERCFCFCASQYRINTITLQTRKTILQKIGNVSTKIKEITIYTVQETITQLSDFKYSSDLHSCHAGRDSRVARGW